MGRDVVTGSSVVLAERLDWKPVAVGRHHAGPREPGRFDGNHGPQSSWAEITPDVGWVAVGEGVVGYPWAVPGKQVVVKVGVVNGPNQCLADFVVAGLEAGDASLLTKVI